MLSHLRLNKSITMKYIRKYGLEVLHIKVSMGHIIHEIYEGINILTLNGFLEIVITLTSIISIRSIFIKKNEKG